MIGISTQTFDIDGNMIFDISRVIAVKNRQGARRVSRTATLDGGVVITDTGHSDGDRDIVIEVPDASITCVDFARYIVENYSLVTVAAEDGAYEAVPESYSVDKGTLEIKLLIKQKLSS